MPVMRDAGGMPEWVAWSNFGFGEVHQADQLERHFHDADEHWVILSGQPRVMSEGEKTWLARAISSAPGWVTSTTSWR